MRFRGFGTFSKFRGCDVRRFPLTKPGHRAVAIIVVFSAGASLFAQKQAGGSAAPPANSTSSGTSRTTIPPQQDNPLNRRPIFLSGKVVLNDGSPPPEPAKLERFCNGVTHVEGYTDRKGTFSIQLGRDMVMQDASIGSADGLSDGNFPNLRGGSNLPQQPGGSGISERQLLGCELRAALSGFRSDSVVLANTHYMDNPDVGVIVLHPLANVAGLTISATSSLAPKDARKAYEKALDAAGKKKSEEAKAGFEKAVGIYPKYAAAWFELGQLSEQGNEVDQARQNYDQSLVADSKYIPPMERLSWLALKENNWERLNDVTNKLLSLDPLNYPNIHYLNAVANLQLKHFDVAEKSAREAIRLDPARRNMRSHYVLGLALASKQEFAAGAESIRTFLNASPNIPDAEAVRGQLAQVEGLAQNKAGQTGAANAETKAEEDKSK